MAQLATLFQRLPAQLRSVSLIIALLAGQYLLVNLFTQPLFGDAPRNLHWGIVTAEQPAFLFGATDQLAMIEGLPPDPPSLGPMHFWSTIGAKLHPWWGPVAPLLFALVWRLTQSYLLLQLVVPIASGAAVVVCYLFARDLLGQRQALLATAFLAWFPIFREFGSTSYIETLSALMVISALFAYWRGNLVWTVILAGLAALTKMDLLPLYIGGVLGCVLASRNTWRPWRYHAIALIGPVVLAAPWIWVHYLNGGSGSTVSHFSLAIFRLLLPDMLALLFYVPWYVSLLILLIIGVVMLIGWRQSSLSPAIKGLLLGWLAVGLAILFVYSGTLGAGNSPRIIIPALPPVAILFASGFGFLSPAWRNRIGFLLLVLFTGVNLMLIGYYAQQNSQRQQLVAAWQALKTHPQGMVLTEWYWETVLFTRQPVTWFETDLVMRHNILTNAANFEHYTQMNKIRYLLIANQSTTIGPEVQGYLDTHAKREAFGRTLIYTLP